MALIKKQELKQMNESQIAQKLVDLDKELLRLNTQRATGTTLENPGKIKQIKKTIAKLHTFNKIASMKRVSMAQKKEPVKEKTTGGKSKNK